MIISNRRLFFDLYRENIDANHVITNSEVKSIDELIDLINNSSDIFTKSQWAYFLATLFHETNGTLEPVIEAYWLSEEWRKKNLRYYPYYGRGFVQITWLKNYQIFSKLLGIDLVKTPELACNKEISFKIAVMGMKKGLFTGKKISDYVNEMKCDYVSARKVINGTDKQSLVAKYAELFLNILSKM